MTKIPTHSKLPIMVTSKVVCGMVEKGKSETELSCFPLSLKAQVKQKVKLLAA